MDYFISESGYKGTNLQRHKRKMTIYAHSPIIPL